MPIEKITVAFVNQPREGGKKGTVKDMHGRYFGVWPDKLDQYEKGGTYEVEYDTTEYQGKTYRNIKRIVSGGGRTPSRAGGGSSAPAGADNKAVEMAVMGLMGRCYQGTGSLPPKDVLEVEMRNIKDAFEAAFSPVVLPNPFEDGPPDENGLDDEIPF